MNKTHGKHIFSNNGSCSYFIIVYKIGYTVIFKNVILKRFHLLVFDKNRYLFCLFNLLKNILQKEPWFWIDFKDLLRKGRWGSSHMTRNHKGLSIITKVKKFIYNSIHVPTKNKLHFHNIHYNLYEFKVHYMLFAMNSLNSYIKLYVCSSPNPPLMLSWTLHNIQSTDQDCWTVKLELLSSGKVSTKTNCWTVTFELLSSDKGSNVKDKMQRSIQRYDIIHVVYTKCRGFLLLRYRWHGGGGGAIEPSITRKPLIGGTNVRENLLCLNAISILSPFGKWCGTHLYQLESLVSMAALCQVCSYM